MYFLIFSRVDSLALLGQSYDWSNTLGYANTSLESFDNTTTTIYKYIIRIFWILIV